MALILLILVQIDTVTLMSTPNPTVLFDLQGLKRGGGKFYKLFSAASPRDSDFRDVFSLFFLH